jgi:hypothetical protein
MTFEGDGLGPVNWWTSTWSPLTRRLLVERPATLILDARNLALPVISFFFVQ